MSDIEVMGSTLYIAKPEDESHCMDEHGIVHRAPFFMKHSTRGYVAHMTQCYRLARAMRAVTRLEPVACVRCLGETEPPMMYAIMDLRT